MRTKFLKYQALLANSFLTLMLIIASGLLNFSFQIFLARTLSVPNYGSFAAMWSAISTAALLTNGLQNQSTSSTVKAMSDFEVDTNERNLLNLLIVALCLVSMVVFIALIVITGFQASKTISILLISFSIPISGLTSVALGRLLGWKGITSFLVIGLALGIVKILSAVVVLPFTENANIIVFMVLISQFLISLVLIRYENMKIKPLSGKLRDYENFNLMLPTSIYWTLVYIDVPLYRYQSSEIDSGIYSGISNFTKLPLILGATVCSFLLVSNNLRERHRERREFVSRVIKFSLIFYFGFSSALLFLGGKGISIAIGVQYQNPAIILGQVLTYFPIYIFGFMTLLYFDRITSRKLVILSSLITLQILVMLSMNLSLVGFFVLYAFFPCLMTVFVLAESFLTNISKESKKEIL